MGKKIKIAFLYTDMQDAQEHLGFDTHREFVRALFLTKHNAIIEDFTTLRFDYKKTGVVVTGEIGRGLVYK